MIKNGEPGIGRWIARIHRGIYNHVAERLKNKDLDTGQFFFLWFILNNEGETQEEIVRNILLDKATVSKAVKRLVHLGYVYREINEEDKRKYKIFATKKAKKLSPEIDAIYKEVYNRLHNHLDVEEVSRLKILLMKVYRNFEYHNPGNHEQ